MADDDVKKGWEDIERAALTCPVLHATVAAVRRGSHSREEALIAAALMLSEFRQDVLDIQVDQLKNAPPFLSPEELTRRTKTAVLTLPVTLPGDDDPPGQT